MSSTFTGEKLGALPIQRDRRHEPSAQPELRGMHSPGRPIRWYSVVLLALAVAFVVVTAYSA